MGWPGRTEGGGREDGMTAKGKRRETRGRDGPEEHKAEDEGAKRFSLGCEILDLKLLKYVFEYCSAVVLVSREKYWRYERIRLFSEAQSPYFE